MPVVLHVKHLGDLLDPHETVFTVLAACKELHNSSGYTADGRALAREIAFLLGAHEVAFRAMHNQDFIKPLEISQGDDPHSLHFKVEAHRNAADVRKIDFEDEHLKAWWPPVAVNMQISDIGLGEVVSNYPITPLDVLGIKAIKSIRRVDCNVDPLLAGFGLRFSVTPGKLPPHQEIKEILGVIG